MQTGFYIGKRLFQLVHLVIQPLQPILHILVFSIVVLIGYIEGVHLVSELVLCANDLTQLLAKSVLFGVQLLCVDAGVDLLSYGCFKLRILHKLADNLGDGGVDLLLAPLLVIGTEVTVYLRAVLAGIEEVILVHAPVRLLLTIHIAVHTSAADRALYETG